MTEEDRQGARVDNTFLKELKTPKDEGMRELKAVHDAYLALKELPISHRARAVDYLAELLGVGQPSNEEILEVLR